MQVLGGIRPDVDERRGQEATGIKWADAVGRTGLDPTLPCLNPDFLRREYEEVVLPAHITTQREYVVARRRGRGYPLNRRQRQDVWKVVEDYRSEALVVGGLSFPEVAAVAAELMRRRIAEGDPHYADHVLVDEGPDLSAVQWQLLRVLAPEGSDDLFIAEDSEQRIYGRQLVLSHFGINIRGRSRRLTLNYRTTAQNLRRAMRELDGRTFIELEGAQIEDRKYRSARMGPEPEEKTVSSKQEALNAAVSQVSRWVRDGEADPETIGVRTRYRTSAEKVMEALVGAGVPSTVATGPVGSGVPDKVQAMTMHRSKGLEFVRVVVILEPYQGRDTADEDYTEQSLAYVAMTRARDELFVVNVV